MLMRSNNDFEKYFNKGNYTTSTTSTISGKNVVVDEEKYNYLLIFELN